MSKQRSLRLRLWLVLLATLAELAMLAWEHLHGGVASHHLLDRADLPSVSNGWGALLVPALAWLLIGRVQRRTVPRPGRHAAATVHAAVATGFLGALLFGAAIAASFTSGQDARTTHLFGGMVVLAILLPGYRAECVLGFVLGMTFTFGAVLPTLVASTIAAASAVMHLCLRPVLMRIWIWLKRLRPAT